MREVHHDFMDRVKFSLALILILSVAVVACSCGPFIDANRGIVSAGFCSSTQGFSGSMTALNGTKVKWSVVGTDGTAVPIALANAMEMYGAAWLANDAYKMAQATTQMQNLGLSNQAIAGIKSQTQIALGAQKAGTTVAGLKTGVFTPAATQFKQP